MPQLSEFYTVFIILAALALDLLLGEPKHHHPLVYFGRWANYIEQAIFPKSANDITQISLKWRGVCALMLAVLPIVALVTLLALLTIADAKIVAIIIDIVILYIAIGNTSLREHAGHVHQALRQGNLTLAKQRVALLVSRDTNDMQEQQVTHATIESVLENGNDAVFAALFWFLIAGAPGVVLYRLCNTLDAMWGYKNTRYLHFGWATAKWDDLLNWVPARLVALTYAVLGHTRAACKSWLAQANVWESRNAGSVMASGAASLGIVLGGTASYHGAPKHRPVLGHGVAPVPDDILRAVRLIQVGIVLWITIIFLGHMLLAAFF